MYTKKVMILILLAMVLVVGSGFAQDVRLFVVSPLASPNQQIFLLRGGRQVFPGNREIFPLRSTSPLPLPGGSLGVGGAVPLRSPSPLPLPGGGLGVGGAVPLRSPSPLPLPGGGLGVGGAVPLRSPLPLPLPGGGLGVGGGVGLSQ